MTTVRQAELGEITGRSRNTIRDMQAQGRTPWNDVKFFDVTQRRFSTEEALALVLCEMLENSGFVARDAAEAVLCQLKAVELFLKDVEAGGDVAPRLVLALRMPVEDSLTGFFWEGLCPGGEGTPEEIEGEIAGNIARIGTNKTRDEGQSRRRYIGGPHVGVASVGEAYRLLQYRAKRLGFTVAGKAIVKDSAGRRRSGSAPL